MPSWLAAFGDEAGEAEDGHTTEDCAAQVLVKLHCMSLAPVRIARVGSVSQMQGLGIFDRFCHAIQALTAQMFAA